MTKRQKQILIGILLLAAVLVFFRLTRHDMLSDDGHYSFRAIGYFDYLGSEKQTTPVQWFGHRPWWSYLSFHDHPPLVFLIQRIFFGIFGVSLFVSRLPSALAAIGSVLVVFFLARRLLDTRSGLIAALALAVNSYFIWTARIALLEGVFTFFMLLAFLYLLKSLDDSKYFIHSGAFFGLTLLSKYTILFALPAVVVFFAWRERWVFRNKKFWQGVLIFGILCLPVVIYNLMMWKTRGHFDVQFSDLFAQPHHDWDILQKRISNPQFKLGALLRTLLDGFSWPYFAAWLGAFVWMTSKARLLGQYALFVLATLSLLVFFAVAGGDARWLGVLAPFAALTIGLAAGKLTEKKWIIAAALGIPLALFSIFYSLNSNNLRRPIGGQKWYADFRLENLGYNQLDKEITKLLSGKTPSPKIKYAATQWWYRDIDPKDIEFSGINQGSSVFNSLLIIDSENIWFPIAWLKERWKLYHRFAFKTTDEFLQVIDAEGGPEVLNFVQFDKIYYFKSGPRVRQLADIKYDGADPIYEALKKQNRIPKVIYDDHGREAFYIYETNRLDL